MNTASRHVGVSCALLLALAFAGGIPFGCKDDSGAKSAPPGGAKADDATGAGPVPANALELTILYGSEKKEWMADCTRAFNDEQQKTADGRPIFVRHVPMGSGDCVEEVLSGRTQAHLISPASGVFITQGNARYRATTNTDLVGSTENLVVSPVVIAMWKPMAEALGWPAKPIGWRDVLDLSKNTQGWAAKGHPEWGQFRFGHTHPEFSNSGLISVLATLYAGAGKSRDLTTDDLGRSDVAAFLRDIEQSVVHYGSSTGFFADKMFENGPGYLSAAVLYESSVIESYARQLGTEFPVVAVYPKEGTFWSDHPVGVVNREWVTEAHKAAAKKYIDFLRAPAQQQKALQFGFRPGDTSITMTAPIDSAHGVDPNEPKATLPVPSAVVVDQAINLWRQNKKHANVVVVFDTSGSMRTEDRIRYAREGTADLIGMLGDEDTVSLLPFSTQVTWAGQAMDLKTNRQAILARVAGLMPQGETALYDAIGVAHDYLAANPRPDRISAIVVMTDGVDSGKGATLEGLLSKINAAGEKSGIRVFTIAYGSDARKDVLDNISNATKAKAFSGKTSDIRKVFKEIATFF